MYHHKDYSVQYEAPEHLSYEIHIHSKMHFHGFNLTLDHTTYKKREPTSLFAEIGSMH